MMICIKRYVFFMTEVCLESRMRSQTWWGVSKLSIRKYWYIGRLYSYIEKVPSDSGIFWSTGELWEFTRRSNGPYWTLVERGKKGHEVACNIPNFQFGMLYIGHQCISYFICISVVILKILSNSRTHAESWGFHDFHIWIFSNIETGIILILIIFLFEKYFILKIYERR